MWKYPISFVLKTKEAQIGTPQGGPYAVELPILPFYDPPTLIKKI